MSPEQKVQNNPDNSPAQETPENTVPEGSLFSDIKERAAETIADGVNTAKLSLHGIAAAIHDKRLRRAGARMERMEHKDALYTDLGTLALTGRRSATPTASGEQAMPRTTIERFMDKQIDRLSYKKSVADTYAYRAEKIFGPKDELPGMKKRERKINKAEVQDHKYSGRLLATDARRLKTKVNASPLKLGETMHKRHARRSAILGWALDQAIDQPGVSTWRELRHDRAINTIISQHHKAEGHRATRSQVASERNSTHAENERKRQHRRAARQNRRQSQKEENNKKAGGTTRGFNHRSTSGGRGTETGEPRQTRVKGAPRRHVKPAETSQVADLLKKGISLAEDVTEESGKIYVREVFDRYKNGEPISLTEAKAVAIDLGTEPRLVGEIVARVTAKQTDSEAARTLLELAAKRLASAQNQDRSAGNEPV